MPRVRARVHDEMYQMFLQRARQANAQPSATRRQEKTYRLMPTGVPGLDGALGSGLPDPGFYLLIGPPGSHHATLARQILYEHVTMGGKVVYYNIEASHRETNEDMALYGWNIDGFLENGSWVYVRVVLPTMQTLLESIPKERLESQITLSARSLNVLKENLLQMAKEGRWGAIHLTQLLSQYNTSEMVDLLLFWKEVLKKLGGIHFSLVNKSSHDLTSIEDIVDGVFEISPPDGKSHFTISLKKLRRVVPTGDVLHARALSDGLVIDPEYRI